MKINKWKEKYSNRTESTENFSKTVKFKPLLVNIGFNIYYYMDGAKLYSQIELQKIKKSKKKQKIYIMNIVNFF